MYEDDTTHTFVLAASSVGVIGVNNWLPHVILILLAAVLLATVGLRFLSRGKHK